MPQDVSKDEKSHLKELKEMILEEPQEPLGKVLTNFCHRHGLSMDQCNKYYEELVKTGEVKEKNSSA
jgi:predicted solute-binding protein